MKNLRITADGELGLPLDYVTQTGAVLAVRGAGKSNLAAAIAEEMWAAKLPFVVIDPVGAWFGLRSSADGKRSGLPILIFGGRHGDVPLEKTAGQMLADLVVDERLTCVLDVSDLSEGDKIRFLIDFGERLYRRNTEPLHLFLEEADDYVPQRPFHEQARLLRVWENIVRRGRARGLGMTMVTQRSAALNKNVLTQIETLFVLRTTSPQDRAAIEAWVKHQGGARDMLDTLPALEAGECWVWSPAWLKLFKRVRIRRRETFDSGATPKHVSGKRPPATLADVDLEAVRTRMAATIERAKAEDPKALRLELAAAKKRAAELERELQRARDVKPTKPGKPVPTWSAKEQATLERLVDKIGPAIVLVAEASHRFEAAVGVVNAAVKLGRAPAPTTPRPTAPTAPRQQSPRPAPVSRPVNGRGAGEGIQLGNTGMRRMLVALCSSPAPITVSQLSMRSIVARRGGTFRTYLGKLLTDGLAERVGERLTATDLGREAVGDYEPLPTGSALLAYWIEQLGQSGAAKMLQVLGDEYPKALSRDELGERTGIAVAGGTFRTYLGKLKTLELVEGKGELRASADLFDGG